MTTTPRTLYDDLSQTDSPSTRSDQLTELADINAMAGEDTKARLLNLVADTEALLADPDIELVTAQDSAWDHDTWWTLANTRDREVRATLLEAIHIAWAEARCGPDADILLEIAKTERAAVGGNVDAAVRAALDAEIAAMDATTNFDAGLADVYTRAALLPDDLDAPLDTDSTHMTTRQRAAGTRRRAIIRIAAPILAGLAVLAMVALVVLPGTPWSARIAAAGVLVGCVVIWFGWLWRGLSR